MYILLMLLGAHFMFFCDILMLGFPILREEKNTITATMDYSIISQRMRNLGLEFGVQSFHLEVKHDIERPCNFGT